MKDVGPFLCYIYLLAFLLGIHGAVSAVKELPLEELHRDDCEDKHEELVHNEDVEDVLQRRDHTVKNSLWGRLTRGTPQKEQAVNELATTEKNTTKRKICTYGTLSLGSRLMVFRGRKTLRTRRDFIVLMSRPLLFLLTVK